MGVSRCVSVLWETIRSDSTIWREVILSRKLSRLLNNVLGWQKKIAIASGVTTLDWLLRFDWERPLEAPNVDLLEHQSVGISPKVNSQNLNSETVALGTLPLPKHQYWLTGAKNRLLDGSVQMRFGSMRDYKERFHYLTRGNIITKSRKLSRLPSKFPKGTLKHGCCLNFRRWL